MIRQEDFEGSSLEGALAQAARRSGLRPEELRYEVLREERGFMGVGTKSIAIRVELPEAPARRSDIAPRRAPTRRPAAAAVAAEDEAFPGAAGHRDEEAEPEISDEDLDGDEDAGGGDESEEEPSGPDPSAPEVAKLVEQLVSLTSLELACQMNEAPDRIVVNLSGDDREELVGRRGELLDALQYLVNRMARRELGTVKRIQLESEGFRSEREEELREMALQAAERVRRTGEPIRLPPLNPYERRIIHVTLSRRGVTTESEGDGFVKRVMIRPLDGRARRSGSGRGPSQRRRR